MNVAIDKLGRLVVPKDVRDRFHLLPGTELALEVDAEGIRLRPSGLEPAFVRKNGFLVHHGQGTSDLDVVEFIRATREQGSAHLTE